MHSDLPSYDPSGPSLRRRGRTLARASACVLVLLVGCTTSKGDDSVTSGANVDENSDAGRVEVDAAGRGAEADASSPEPSEVSLPAEWPGHGSADCVNHTNSDPSINKFQ